MKKGILLAAFGSENRQGESSYRRFDALVRQRFPGISVRWAFTSVQMRERLASTSSRKKSDSVRKALDRMAFEKYTHVAVQPLHLNIGFEYNTILQAREQVAERFTALQIGAPLLTDDPEDARKFAEILMESLPEGRKADEAVLFMGHGSRFSPDKQYIDVARVLQEHDPLVLLGTLNGAVRLEHVLPQLAGVRKVWLLQLLAVVGRHTLEDMAGQEHWSWYSRLAEQGKECVPVLRGMTEYEGLLQMWADRLAEAVQRLQV